MGWSVSLFLVNVELERVLYFCYPSYRSGVPLVLWRMEDYEDDWDGEFFFPHFSDSSGVQ